MALYGSVIKVGFFVTGGCERTSVSGAPDPVEVRMRGYFYRLVMLVRRWRCSCCSWKLDSCLESRCWWHFAVADQMTASQRPVPPRLLPLGLLGAFRLPPPKKREHTPLTKIFCVSETV